ncbi:MAG: type II toxin-antitoxin system VapB family antitoxin [Acidobacteriota bacterium]
MRTNIDLDDDLMREAARYSKASSKRALVEEALRKFVSVKAAEERLQNYAERLAGIRSRTASLKLREAPSQILREDRDRT